ncbi:MAG TPA: ribonucleotide-diphosphate reductase subunit beta [Actinomycetota bacterium]|nr:ribonucleotide-diphosphate reductase subunit beta [Actinomycetota bacterium]
MRVAEDTRDLTELAEVDPDSILDRLNDTITRRMPSYRELYLRWERLNWSVSELDFSADRGDWLALDQHHRDRLLWTLAAFYVAEQRVAATLTPYVTAAPLLEQKIFLTTQCVDEARHAIFFDRWFQEVVAAGDGDLARRLRSSRQWVGPGFGPLFDEYLEDVTSQLRANPTDRRHFAKAMAVYHIVIEGVLALTGQKFILAWARDRQILPGFRAGFTAVARDESRHVAFGARVIRDLLKEDPSLIEAIHEGISETLALGSYLYQPPGGDVTYTSAFGYTLGDLFQYGGIQLEKKMRAIGAPMPKVEISVPLIDTAWPPPGGGMVAVSARDRVSAAALRAFGRVAPRFSPGMSVMMLHLAFRPEATRGVDTIYELDLRGPGGDRFSIHINDGTCDIRVGPAGRPADVVYTMDASTWLAMAQGRVTGDEAVLLGRLRIAGDPSVARRFNEYFRPPGLEVARTAARVSVDRGLNPLTLGSRLARRVLRSSEDAA